MSGIVDLEDYITDWAWLMFDALKTKDESKIPRDSLQLQINWNKVKFQHGRLLRTEQGVWYVIETLNGYQHTQMRRAVSMFFKVGLHRVHHWCENT